MQNPTAGALNAISALWFRTFMDTIDPAQTAAELAFLERQLPVQRHRTLLDLCCGQGRHAAPLSARGYQVTGVDRAAEALAEARVRAPAAQLVQSDVLAFCESSRERWAACIIMWASFGYFEPGDNLRLLARIRELLVAGGRLVLDVYNRDFFVNRLEPRTFVRNGTRVIERKRLVADRMFVELHYPEHATVDHFSWQVFTPAELCETAVQAGFQPVLLCSAFQEETPASAGTGRMQIVLER